MQESMCTVYYQAKCTELIVDDDVSLCQLFGFSWFESI